MHPLRQLRAICEEIQGVAAIDFTRRGFDTMVLPPFEKDLSETTCVNCGQCTLACPTGALHEVRVVEKVMQTLQEGKKFLVAQAAPAIRVSLGDFFGMEPGANVTGKVAAALRRIGFRQVFDTDFAADLTIMEEGTELVNRIKAKEKLPLFTSCCPAWIKYAEIYYPKLLSNISSCKSPQEMMGATIKSYLAQKQNIDPKDIFVVSVMPCTAKKFEAARPELSSETGISDVDAVLTTRQLNRLMQIYGIDFASLPEEEFDRPFGAPTGSGDIFAASGGVMESALRSAYYLLTNKDLTNVEFNDVRGMTGVKEASVKVGGPHHQGGRCQPPLECAADRRQGDAGRLALGFHRDHGLPGRMRGRRRAALRLRPRSGDAEDQGDLFPGKEPHDPSLLQEPRGPGRLQGVFRATGIAQGARAPAHGLRAPSGTQIAA